MLFQFLFFRLNWHFNWEKSVFWKTSFFHKKNWLRVQGFLYRVFSLTWPASMQIYGNKRSVCIRKEFNSQRIGLGHQHGRRFIVLGHQYGRRDVMWKHSIRQCLNKVFYVFFSEKLIYKINRKLLCCVCIAWFKHERGWWNSRQLCKASTSFQVCITVSNCPNPSRVYLMITYFRDLKNFAKLKSR